MSGRHRALIVEDDREMAEELLEILGALDIDGLALDSRAAATEALQRESFCLIVLDLQIRSGADSIKGHVEHGRALLRQIRQWHTDHSGPAWWLPVVVVSGFAREADEAVDVMKDGASDVIQKPFQGHIVSERIRQALQMSGRDTHEACGPGPTTKILNAAEGMVVAIPGDRIRRRTRVTVGSKPADITDASLKVLLRLMLARAKGGRVHKIDLGASAEQGFKGVSNLRNELKAAIGATAIIENDYQGNYWLIDKLAIGKCAVEKLLSIGDQEISRLVQELPAAHRAE